MKIGDYVRTKYGIAKYISDKVSKYAMYYVIDKDIMICNVDGWENCISGSNEIIKSSPNIIDLIEVGDYVNGELITRVQPQDICGDEVLDNQHIYTGEFAHNTEIYEYEIKSIVTKEQFESMEYKL